MLQHVKVGDVLKNRAGNLIKITNIGHSPDYPILYTMPNDYEFTVTIEGRFCLDDSVEYPYDIIDPTIYNTDSTKAESLTSVEPVNYTESRTIYNLGHIITLPNGTQLYQSDTGHIQLIPQPGAPIWQQFN